MIDIDVFLFYLLKIVLLINSLLKLLKMKKVFSFLGQIMNDIY